MTSRAVLDKQLQRITFSYMWYAHLRRYLSRPLCLILRHKYWARENLLTALATGRSKRCLACNRLVLKPENRHE